MMISTILLCSSTLSLIISGVYSLENSEWKKFLLKNGKNYANETAETWRYAQFKMTSMRVAAHNVRFRAGLETYALAVNKFADLSEEERSKLHCISSLDQQPFQRETITFASNTSSRRPDSINWVERGCVSPIQDQSSCGSCWAFSTLGSLEGVTCAVTGQLTKLSEQQLVDCCIDDFDMGCHGCMGASLPAAFIYVRKTGVMRSADYPYVAKGGKCLFNRSLVAERSTGFVHILPGDEDGLAEAVATYGPIAIGISLTRIFDDPKCATSIHSYPAHGVVLVGYGTENGIPYWLVKNSWGNDWGDNGYIRMRRGRNLCIVANSAFFPLI